MHDAYAPPESHKIQRKRTSVPQSRLTERNGSFRLKVGFLHEPLRISASRSRSVRSFRPIRRWHCVFFCIRPIINETASPPFAPHTEAEHCKGGRELTYLRLCVFEMAKDVFVKRSRPSARARQTVGKSCMQVCGTNEAGATRRAAEFLRT